MTEPEAQDIESADSVALHFSLPIGTPAGTPWEQWTAARLSARIGAPIDLEHLEFQIVRLAPWRPGQSGRFLVAYVRRADLSGGITFQVTADGKPYAFEFGFEDARRARRLWSSALVAALVGTTLSLVAAGIVAQARQTRDETALTLLEEQALAANTAAKSIAQRRRQAVALDAIGMRGHTVQALLDDLAWASRAKTPQAQIVEFDWTPDQLRVRSAGREAPFAASDRSILEETAARDSRTWLIRRQETQQ